MHFELEKLFRRKLIKDFFACHSESKWETLLQTLLELGVAYLANNFNISELSLQNLQKILSKFFFYFKI
jgi:phage terminase large subunit